MKSTHVLLFLMPELLSAFAYRIASSGELLEIDSSKPIARYLKGNSKQYCKWCNMRPEKQYGKNGSPVRDMQPAEEIDLFDIPIYAALTQDQGNLDKQRLSDFIGRYF
ncbi:uncharacterized protein LOC123865099 [Maniola jurtina]|uniref:uncharacterized protein LOC123865099 n=1 Tax=Maniola jurtina TaxID=191418 RepID=UPI001E6883D8|nr:uncharacterized protein LOC123865099 [Maniola jurtina]